MLLRYWKYDLCDGQEPGFCAGEKRRAVNQVFTVRSPHNIWRVWPERDTAPPPPRHFYAERALIFACLSREDLGKINMKQRNSDTIHLFIGMNDKYGFIGFHCSEKTGKMHKYKYILQIFRYVDSVDITQMCCFCSL